MRAPAWLLLLTLIVPWAERKAEAQALPDPSARAAWAHQTPPNIIVLIFDALRADALGCYGSPFQITPALDRLATTATLFPYAIASAPTTLPSHASMFTGLPVFMHGARTLSQNEPAHNVNPLHQDFWTLAEFLSEEGYATAAFFANAAFLSRYWQLDQGFQTYSTSRVWSNRLNPAILEWIDRPRREPFFVCVNYIDTHRPYNTTPVHGLPWPIPPDDNVTLIETLESLVMNTEAPLPPDLLNKLSRQYAAAVANVDREFRVFMEALQARNLYDNTLILITADHGEFFGEHRLIGHGKDVFEAVIRVPLLLKAPGQSMGRRDARPVAGMDIPHLILSHLPASIQDRGARRFPFKPGNHPLISEKYYGGKEMLFHERFGARLNRIRIAVVDLPWKLIYSSDGKHELYHLHQDPGEQLDQYATHPQEARRLQNQLRSFIKRHGITIKTTPGKSPLGADDLANLKALGYLQ